MFPRTCSIIIVFFLLFASKTFGSGNINNPGFEDSLNDWYTMYGFQTEISQVNHSGGSSAKKTVGYIPNQDYFSLISQDIYFNEQHDPYPTGSHSYLTNHVKTNMNPITKSSAGLQMQFINSNNQVINSISRKVGGQTDWRYLYIDGVTPAGTTKIRVSGFQFARLQDSALGGISYYDDFVYSPTPLPQPLPRTDLLNGNFENGLNDWDEGFHPAEVSQNIKHGGNYAAVYTIDSSVIGPNPQDYYAVLSQDVSVAPGDDVVVSGWIKTNLHGGVNSFASLGIIFLDSQNNQIDNVSSSQVNGITDWILKSVSSVVPVGAVKMRYGFSLFGNVGNVLPGDKLYFDDANIQIIRAFQAQVKLIQ